MRIGYFPGCSLEGSSREYDESLRAIAAALGVELAEVPDWNCCGASAAHNLNHVLALALPARTLALAERAGFDELLVPCSACYTRLAVTRHELLHDEKLRQQITNVIELDYVGSTRVLSVVELLARLAPTIREKTVHPFAHKLACYYGCYLTRPTCVASCKRTEDPTEMDDICKAAGATTVDWAFKVECCGAGLSISRTSSVAELSARILEDAVDRGAEAIVVACPMCHTNLDLRRPAIEKAAGRRFDVPVLYVSQVIGLALGLDGHVLGLHRHHVPVRWPASVVAAREEH
ncbi:MAG: CoB--CoM heterodisulfide reductase iron-sulfur subunit B family protein [Phycisphaerales bacterium]|nr:CoB--CoM heterodisulfide reductase iron-sulfur subunit B family protein [Phycisphaerales bacterium]